MSAMGDKLKALGAKLSGAEKKAVADIEGWFHSPAKLAAVAAMEVEAAKGTQELQAAWSKVKAFL